MTTADHSHHAGEKRRSGYASDDSDLDLSFNEDSYNSESDNDLPKTGITHPESSSQSSQTIQPHHPPSTPRKPAPTHITEHGAESIPELPATPTLVQASQSTSCVLQPSATVSSLPANTAIGALSTATSELSPLKVCVLLLFCCGARPLP